MTIIQVSAEDMKMALGDLYDPTLPLPNASYTRFTTTESNEQLEKISQEVATGSFSRSGPEREQSWGDSWAAVRDKFKNSNYDLTVLDPPYVSANPIVRWMGQYVRAESLDFEMEVYRYIRESVFRKLIKDAIAVHDVGAGSCFNSVAYLQYNPKARVFAYDWAEASQDIAHMLWRQHNMKIYGHHVDFYDCNITVDPLDVVMTTCALEQVGDKWFSFLDNMWRARPRIVVHIEPILEKYTDTPFDTVARDYHTSRNYLSGYYEALLKLQDKNKIKIVCDHRTGIGSRFHECYTVIAWKLL